MKKAHNASRSPEADGLKPADYHAHLRSEIFPYLPEKACRVIDFGGGYGATLSHVRQKTGASFAMVADLFEPEQASADGVDQFAQGDLNDLSFVEQVLADNGPFDLMLCLDVLEHLVDPWAFLDIAQKFLNPGGTVVASIPNVNHVSALIPLLLSGNWTLTDKGILDRTHLRFFVKQTALDLMKTGDLEVADWSAHVAKRPSRHYLADKMSFGLMRRFFARQYIVKASKSA